MPTVLQNLLLASCLAVHAPPSAMAADADAALQREFRAAAEAAGTSGTMLLYALDEWLTPEVPVARELDALAGLDGEIGNGGFDQYFFNTASDHWSDAIAAANRIGDPEAATLIEQAVVPFGASGPSHDRAARQAQLERIARDAPGLWDELDSAWYRHEKVLEERILTWTRAHVGDLVFRSCATPATTFSCTVLFSTADPPSWMDAVNRTALGDGRCRSTGAHSTSTFAATGTLWLLPPPDRLQLILIEATDEKIREVLSLCARFAPLQHLRCVVVGDVANAGVELDPAWAVDIAAIDAAGLANMLRVLGEALAPAPAKP